jgi:hypothetical protein
MKIIFAILLNAIGLLLIGLGVYQHLSEDELRETLIRTGYEIQLNNRQIELAIKQMIIDRCNINIPVPKNKPLIIHPKEKK